MRFLLEIDGIVKAGFSRCRLRENKTDVVEYREGNDPPTARKLWGLNRYGPLVLESGVTDASVELFEWREMVERGALDEARGPVAIVVLNEEGEPGPRWELRSAWPASYEGPTLDAAAEDVAIERLELVHEGLTRTARDTRTNDSDDSKEKSRPTESVSETGNEEVARRGRGGAREGQDRVTKEPKNDVTRTSGKRWSGPKAPDVAPKGPNDARKRQDGSE